MEKIYLLEQFSQAEHHHDDHSYRQIQEISLACGKRQSGVRVNQEQVHAPSLFILCSAYISHPIIGILHDTASRMELRLDDQCYQFEHNQKQHMVYNSMLKRF
ncbi:proteinaceous RNase P 3 [Striga asiatica]|uniref:Proteinaceous RNase P 3 n=1 Tax=Striga asiatica TaxID=4170 RepID=A0A5A7PSR3_STRAF|nr:proteinaceous RNase P 3 [Striga asiatica]